MFSILVELQRLKSLERTGWMLRGLPTGTESVAAHSFGVSTTAMLLADELIARGETLDLEKILRMALLHDWAETRVGDMPRTATKYFGPSVRKQAETAAFADIIKGLGVAETLYLSIYDEYEQRNSIEAQLVKAADVIDLLVQVLALERAGAKGLDEFWEIAQTGHLQLEGVARKLIRDILDSLLAARESIS